MRPKNKCQSCKKVCNIGGCGNGILIDFPYGHRLDSMDRFLIFCSDKCAIKYIKKGGDYK